MTVFLVSIIHDCQFGMNLEQPLGTYHELKSVLHVQSIALLTETPLVINDGV